MEANVDNPTEASSNTPPESVNADPSSTQKQPKDNKREKSSIWDHFTRDPSDKAYSTCDYCTQRLKCPSRNGTTSLRNHLARCKKYPYNVDKKQKLLIFQSQSSVQDSRNSTFTTWKFDQAMCIKYLARMIILDEKPFMIVEQEGFRAFVNMLQPQFQIPSKIIVARDCFEIYTAEKESLKKYFRKTKQRVCLTIDLWSSRQNLSYMCLTAHFIDEDWKIHKRILNFSAVSGHSGEILGKYIEKILIDWGIDKVLTVTVDNVSSNDLVVRYLKKRLNTWKNKVGDSSFRIRSAVKYVRSSPAQLQRFRGCVEKVKIETKGLVCLDVETRWNSTYLMLESAIKFQSAFDMLEEQDIKYNTELLSSKGVPLEEDWDYANSIMLPFLSGFYNSTLRISGSLYVTSNMYYHEVFGLGAMIKKKMTDEDASLRKMAGKMKLKYDNIDNMNIYLFIGPILDPRHKLGYVSFIIKSSFNKDKADELIDKIDRVLEELFNHYSAIVGVVNESSGSSSRAVDENECMEVDEDPAAFLNNQYKRQLEESSGFTGVRSEKDKYLEEQCEPLQTMARDILAIPASTVASESAFSTEGRVLDAFCSNSGYPVAAGRFRVAILGTRPAFVGSDFV
ncbi:hypothetical protein OSB04_031197, partial [Centaurea solstitialis]